MLGTMQNHFCRKNIFRKISKKKINQNKNTIFDQIVHCVMDNIQLFEYFSSTVFDSKNYPKFRNYCFGDLIGTPFSKFTFDFVCSS